MADILSLAVYRRRYVPPAGTYPSRDEIAGRAYVLFLQAGRLRPFAECWRAAERELLDRGARRVLRELDADGGDAA